MAPKRKITVDLPNSRKSRDKNDRLDRSINDNKSREHSRNSDKDKKDSARRAYIMSKKSLSLKILGSKSII